jgi:hypothetical protein
VGRTGLDVVDIVISSSRIVVVVIASPPSPPRSAASSKPLPDNRRYVACWDRSWEGSVRPLGGGGQHPRRLNRMQQKKKQHIIFVFFLSLFRVEYKICLIMACSVK